MVESVDDSINPELLAVLDSAARLQELIPDAVLVGGTVASLDAGHRLSYDHDHVVADLRQRFDVALEALEREPDWVMNRVTPGKIILGELGDIEAGVRQLIRTRPLETREIELPSGQRIVVPTRDEILLIKAFLIVRRNQTRDYLDVAALSQNYGVERTATVLSGIDQWYADETKDGTPVSTQLARQLADPRPADLSKVSLAEYKKLSKQWHNWNSVKNQIQHVAAHMSIPAEG